MIKILDCETLESIYLSIAEISGVNQVDLEKLIEDFDLDAYYEQLSDAQWTEPENIFLSKLQSIVDKPLSFDATAWFHVTRTDPNNTFSEGLRPLGLAIDQIWEFLFSLLPDGFTETDWTQFKYRLEHGQFPRNHSNGAYQYQLKVPNLLMGGPYAILVRNIAFVSDEVGNHDYLRTPEIVEDICGCLFTEYKLDLMPTYLNRTKSCFVKFLEREG